MNSKQFKTVTECVEVESEGELNPFARGGLARSPPRGAGASTSDPKAGSSGKSGSVPEETQMTGADLTRALNRNRSGLPKMVVVAEQLDELIGYASGRHNISKDLKQGLLKLRKSLALAKKEFDLLAEERCAADASKEERSTQTDSFLVADKATKQHETMQLAGAVAERSSRPTTQAARTKPVVKPRPKQRQAEAGVEPQREAKGAAGVSNQASKPVAKRARGKANPKRGGSQPDQGKENPWITVGNRKHPRKGKTARKRVRSDALVIKAEADTYAEVLKAMRGENRLSSMGADVKSIRRTRTGEMMVVLKKDAAEKGASYKALAQEVLGGKVQVRALTAEATLQCKNLDEIACAEELAAVLKQQCDVDVPSASIHMRKGPAGTQIATFKLPVGEANKAVTVGSVKLAWSVCPLSIHEPPLACFKCFEQGHKSWACKGPDRSKLCRRCGVEGHFARECNSAPKCLICTANKGHMTGGPKCPATRGGRSVKR